MSAGPEAAARRAARLLRWYPRDWRSRYGDEFAELLIADISERPDSWRRDADVAISGVLARLIPTGLTGHAIDPADQVRASLASLGYLLGVFLSLGVALWSQLTIGWQWSKPDAATISVAMILMSGAAALLCGLAALAAIPIAGTVILRFARRQPDGLIRPALFFVAGTAVLVIGGRHFGNGWPGTGGHPWAHQGLVPGGVAAFTWASTLWVSSYWAHPGSLALFPAAELAWMAVSPVAIAFLLTGATRIIRRAGLSSRTLRYEAFLARAAAFGMFAFLLGACTWVVSGGPGPRAPVPRRGHRHGGDHRDDRRPGRGVPGHPAGPLRRRGSAGPLRTGRVAGGQAQRPHGLAVGDRHRVELQMQLGGQVEGHPLRAL